MSEENSYARPVTFDAAAYSVRENHSALSETNLIDSLTLLARRKLLLAVVTGAATLVGLVYCCWILAPLFTATTRIMTPQQTQSSAVMLMNQSTNLGAASLAGATGSGLGFRNPNDLYIGLLNSRPIADAIIKQFGLIEAYHAKDMTGARKILKTSTKILSEKSGLLAISVTDKDKGRAAEIANAYTEQLRVLTTNLAVTEASQRRLFYEDQLKSAKEHLIAAEFAFQRIQEQRGLIHPELQVQGVVQSLTALHARIAAKRVEVQALRTYSTEKNPDLRLAENELSTLQQESTRLHQASSGSGDGEFGLQDVAGADLDYLRAQHELQYRQILFDLLLKQFDSAKLDEAKDAAVIQVVEAALPPEEKSSPYRTRTVLASLIFGFLGAATWILLGDFQRRNPGVSKSLQTFASALFNRREFTDAGKAL